MSLSSRETAGSHFRASASHMGDVATGLLCVAGAGALTYLSGGLALIAINAISTAPVSGAVAYYFGVSMAPISSSAMYVSTSILAAAPAIEAYYFGMSMVSIASSAMYAATHTAILTAKAAIDTVNSAVMAVSEVAIGLGCVGQDVITGVLDFAQCDDSFAAVYANDFSGVTPDLFDQTVDHI